MSNIFDIVDKIQSKNKKQEEIKLDAQASYTAMEECLKVLEMNSLPELRNVKAMMRRTMKDMVSIGKYGKKERSR